MTPVSSSPFVVSVHSSSTHGFSKPSRSSIRLIANHGVEGDAHAGEHDRHLFHIKRFGPQINLRQVHLIQAELFDALALLGHAIAPGALGENICTRGIDLLALPARTRLHLGSTAVIELTGLRNPCVQIERFRPGLLAQLVEKTEKGLIRKAGVMAIVLCGGEIGAGSKVDVELPTPPLEPLVYLTPKAPLRPVAAGT